MPDTPEALNAKLQARIVRQNRRIVALEIQLGHYKTDHVAKLLAEIRTNVGNAQMDDREFREFVRRLLG